MFWLVLEKAEGPEIKLPMFAGSLKEQESSRKNIYFCFIDHAKAFDCVDHNKLWKILQEMRISDHLKVSAWNAGDPDSIPGSGRSPGEGNDNPLQYSCLENPMEGGARWATVHGVSKSRTRLSEFTSLHLTPEKSVCRSRNNS